MPFLSVSNRMVLLEAVYIVGIRWGCVSWYFKQCWWNWKMMTMYFVLVWASSLRELLDFAALPGVYSSNFLFNSLLFWERWRFYIHLVKEEICMWNTWGMCGLLLTSLCVISYLCHLFKWPMSEGEKGIGNNPLTSIAVTLGFFLERTRFKK